MALLAGRWVAALDMGRLFLAQILRSILDSILLKSLFL